MAECLGDKIPDYFWRDKEILRNEYHAHGDSIRAVVHAHHGTDRNLLTWWSKHGLPPLRRGGRVEPVIVSTDDQWLLSVLQDRRGEATVEEVADQADVSPRRVREAAARLRDAGHRVEIGEGEAVVIEKVPPKRENLHTALFDGDTLRVGVVSDTHIGSKEQALNELHLCYDIFEREGITEVWHAGDWGCGIGVYRGQHAEAYVHTLDEQIDCLEDNYPRRDGIVTRGIGGNHDLAGDAAAVGLDITAALASRRPDIDYLGTYEAWIELRPGTGKWVHLMHGAGGMSYSWSYKAQKLVDNYPGGRKPAVLIPGHWHVRGNVRARDVEVLWPGCFEWQSAYMARLGLHGTVGFHILEMTVADDGSVVRFAPEWFPFYQGRHVVPVRKRRREAAAV